jgi:uncharacterized protein YhfF
LVSAALDGTKTATSSLRAEWTAAGDPLPAVGQHQTVVDSADRPVGTIELTSVQVIRLGDADDALALDEGEGYGGVADWRHAHERFWHEHVVPHHPHLAATGLDDDTEVVVERFRVVAIEEVPPAHR